jgi:antitoxin (DNA-binding transcriptional repressor) of toxin-antitoxin stability system
VRVNGAEAKNKLPKRIRAVENGESVTICRSGVPIVDIVQAKEAARKRRTLGTLRGKVRILDPDWWKPMTGNDVDAFIKGRY